MRPLDRLLPYDEALARVVAACRPVTETESIRLADSEGRVLAEPVVAPADVPSFDRAAMDGYALRARDATAPGARLRPVGVVHAGSTRREILEVNDCVQIATGAPVPPGADAVVAVERTRVDGDVVVLADAMRERQNVSPRGSDMARGTQVGAPGHVLTPARIAILAATGRDVVRVWRRSRVTVVSTGSELRAPGTSLGPGEIYETNGLALGALFRSHGVDVAHEGPVPDEVNALRAVLRRHADQDVIVLSGGSSAGERDVVQDAVTAEGSIDFHGVRVKPGKPLLLGRVGDAVVVGLPGYPTSCLSDAYLFVLPALRRIAHRPAEPVRRVSARLGERVAGVPGRVWFLPVRLDGPRAVPTYKESGATTSLADADGYVTIPADVPFVDAGDAVEVILF